MNLKFFVFFLFCRLLFSRYSLGRGALFWWDVHTNCIFFSCTSHVHLFTYRRTVSTTLALLIAYRRLEGFPFGTFQAAPALKCAVHWVHINILKKKINF